MNYHLSDLSRRAFVESAAKMLWGVSILPFAAQTAGSAPADSKRKRLIYLFMNGAMSQLDTFDPKPGTEVQGPTGVIKTKVRGMQFGEHLPKLAAMAEELAVVRSLSTATGAHGPGRYLMRTNYKQLATTRHPGLGSWMQMFHGRLHKDLPPSVQVGGGEGPGYLGAQYAPVPVGDPTKGLQNTKSPKYVTDELFDRRMELSKKFDAGFRRRTKLTAVNGYDDLYRDAIGLLRSQDLKAFDISQEKESVRTKYGDSKFAKGCLLARRLMEHGVQYVEVNLGSWDHHNEIAENVSTRCADLDHGVTTLMSELKSSGLLDETLIVIATEFGRKPRINQNAGRDHHPAAFSCVLAGAGIHGGQAYGSTDKEAFYVEDDSVSVQDFNATIGKALGLPITRTIHSPDGRPFTLAHDGNPIDKII